MSTNKQSWRISELDVMWWYIHVSFKVSNLFTLPSVNLKLNAIFFFAACVQYEQQNNNYQRPINVINNSMRTLNRTKERYCQHFMKKRAHLHIVLPISAFRLPPGGASTSFLLDVSVKTNILNGCPLPPSREHTMTERSGQNNLIDKRK